MKLALLCVCALQLAFGSCRLFIRTDPLPAARGDLSASWASQSAGSMNEIRMRPLFARRGHYERQRILVPKAKGAPAAEMRPNPVKMKCAQLSQSCLPQSGCCDPCATCHCHFFNAICFCRRANSQEEIKT